MQSPLQSPLHAPLNRIALAVEYDGREYCGWQRQPHCHSVQAEVERALGRIACEDVVIHCAGRTDTGVHAAAQIVHFETRVERPLRAWTFGTNSHLARDVAIHWAAIVPRHFHARHSALSRSYRYTILNRSCRPGLASGQVAWERQALDAPRMHEAAQTLLGEYNFSSFRSSECQARHAVRTLMKLAVQRQGDRVIIEVQANGFLHNMVRILAGCLIRIGRGDRPVEWLAAVRELRDRRQAAMTAPPQGLTFLQPTYPPEFGIPDFTGSPSVADRNEPAEAMPTALS